jgi:hypothetical protein
VNTEPPTTIPAVAPSEMMFTFSRSVDLRARTAERPIARIAIGIADSMPWPSLSATYAAAAEKSMVIARPNTMERPETSGILLSGGTIGR